VKVGDVTDIRKRTVAGEINGQITWRDNETRVDAAILIRNNYGSPGTTTSLHNDPELFRLVQETLGIPDPDKRAEAFKKLYLRLRDETYHLGIGYVNIPWAVGPRVLTWRPYPLALYPSALHTITLK
jgi:ABC-type transport system substrate-binding protein